MPIPLVTQVEKKANVVNCGLWYVTDPRTDDQISRVVFVYRGIFTGSGPWPSCAMLGRTRYTGGYNASVETVDHLYTLTLLIPRSYS